MHEQVITDGVLRVQVDVNEAIDLAERCRSCVVVDSLAGVLDRLAAGVEADRWIGEIEGTNVVDRAGHLERTALPPQSEHRAIFGITRVTGDPAGAVRARKIGSEPAGSR